MANGVLDLNRKTGKANISEKYRNADGSIKENDLKDVLAKTFAEIEMCEDYTGHPIISFLNYLKDVSDLNFTWEQIKESEKKKKKLMIDELFNVKIVERIAKLNDKYNLYKTRENERDLINYSNSYDAVGTIFNHIGPCKLVDENFKANQGIRVDLWEAIKTYKNNKLEIVRQHRLNIFYPYVKVKLKEGGNFRHAKNRFRENAKVGDITNNVSKDYLCSVTKLIFKEYVNAIPNFTKELFQKYIRSGKSKRHLKRYLKGMLQHSAWLQHRQLDINADYSLQNYAQYQDDKTENSYVNAYILKDESAIKALNNNNKTYRLDVSIFKQLQRIGYNEINELWEWKLTNKGAFLLLGTRGIDSKDKLTDYGEGINNQEVRLKVELEEPSQNRLYGSHKQRSNYRQELDNEYFVEDKEIYQFKNTHGLGFQILSQYTNPEQTIKLDAKDISGTYREVDKIKGKRKVGGEKYYGQNIVYKPSRYELVYLYGPNNEDKLIIDGFKNGDYGINLKDKVREAKDEKAPITYTPHRVRSKPFEFKILEKLEITKSIYDHTRVTIKGVIDEDNAKEYERKLDVKDPKLVMTYNNQDHKILFKGIIEAYDLEFKRREYYLTIKAVSYSKLLKRARRNRIYQNLGTTYGQVSDKLMEDNPKFNIVFADDAQAQTPLTTKDYPLILQYKESEWDFLKRISSYLNLPVIVDDTKDDQEGINILLGTHIGKAKELDNISVVEIKKTRRKNHKFHYYKVDCHEHFRSKEVFDIGKKVKYRLTNQEERTIDLVIIKNKIYVEEGVLCSDLTLVREEEINILQERRETLIKGRSFRVKVMKLNNDHTAQVDFIDIEDEYDEAKSFKFPIDRDYTNSYFAQEIGDIVDIYFKSQNEKYATLKSSSTDNDQEIDHDPADKLIKTPGGFKMLLNNQEIIFASKEDKAKMWLREESLNFSVADKSKIILDKDKINLKTGKANGVIDDNKTEFSFGSKRLKISKDGINIS